MDTDELKTQENAPESQAQPAAAPAALPDVAVGANYSGETDVAGWKDMAEVSAGLNHTVGLKKDGTVVATGDNSAGQCDVSGWRNVGLPASSEPSAEAFAANGKETIFG